MEQKVVSLEKVFFNHTFKIVSYTLVPNIQKLRDALCRLVRNFYSSWLNAF